MTRGVSREKQDTTQDLFKSLNFFERGDHMNSRETLDIKCPEDYGTAKLTFSLKEHVSGGVVDRRAVSKVGCDIQDRLLKQGKNCDFSCKDTQEYRTFKRNLEI